MRDDSLHDTVSPNCDLLSELINAAKFWATADERDKEERRDRVTMFYNQVLWRMENPKRVLDSQKTIRDSFAEHALCGVILKCAGDSRGESLEDMFAAKAYLIADSMMEARK